MKSFVVAYNNGTSRWIEVEGQDHEVSHRLTPAKARALAAELTRTADEIEGLVFPIGTPVRRKDSEYLFQGIFVSVFAKLNGSVRLVVEGTQEGNRGMLHVMSEKNLEKVS